MDASTSTAVSDGTDHDKTNQSHQIHQDNSKVLKQVENVWTSMLTIVSKLREKIRLDTLRPLPIFLGISGPSFCFDPLAFNAPSTKLDKSTMEKIVVRLRINLAYFMTNYALIVMGVTVVVSLMYLDMLFALALICSLWWFHIATSRGDIPLVISNIDIRERVSENARTSLLLVFTFIVGVWFCIVPTICVAAISMTLIIFHALMRDPNHIDATFSYVKSADDDDVDSELSEGVIINRRDVV